DIGNWWDGQSLTGERVLSEAGKLGAKELGGDFALPVFVIQGGDDFNTPTSLAKVFAESLRAPHREYVEIPEAGHFAVFTGRDVFLAELSKRVLPVIAPGGRQP